MGSSDLARALTDVGETINACPTFDEAVQAVARLARSVVPDIDHAGVMLAGRRGRIRVEVATDALAGDLDQLQIAHRRGPGPCAMEHGRIMIVDRIQNERRWPEYTRAAAAHGVRSQLALRLDVDERTHGAINLYCTSRESLPQQSLRAAWLYATHAGWALGHVRLRQNLEAVLDSRHVIGTACGLVMQRYRLDHDNALAYLTRVSQARNVKLRELALDLVDRVEKQQVGLDDLGQIVRRGPERVPSARRRDSSSERRRT